jgi:hypothetical protein
LIFAARLAFIGWPFATATICRMLTKAGAAAARIESSVDTQAVEQAVQDTARNNTTIRPFFISILSLSGFRFKNGFGNGTPSEVAKKQRSLKNSEFKCSWEGPESHSGRKFVQHVALLAPE